jgi:hypothetical protein
MMHEASLVASMCTAAPKRLAMFDSKQPGVDVGGLSQSQQQQQQEQEQQQQQRLEPEDSLALAMDSLADQLADFKSFGASLTASTSGAAPFSPEAPTASAGSG